MPKRRVDHLLDRLRQCGFTGARCSVQENDLAVGHVFLAYDQGISDSIILPISISTKILNVQRCVIIRSYLVAIVLTHRVAYSLRTTNCQNDKEQQHVRWRDERIRMGAMVVVVGAGPAGLATAYELQRRGLPYRVVEQHTVGYAWQNHYDRLHLHTLKQVSGLPGLPMPKDYPRFPSASQVHAYLENYVRHFRLNITCGVKVLDAHYRDRCWELDTNQGRIIGDTLVVATGIWSTPYQPQFADQDRFTGPIIHSSIYRNPTPFTGQRVLVVGTGNSGAEIAVDLREHGVDTSVAIRSGATFIPHPRSALRVRAAATALRYLPRSLGEQLLRWKRRDWSAVGIAGPSEPLLNAYPVVGYALPEAIAAGRITRYGGITRFVPHGVQFEDGHIVPFDAVIMATGYRPTVQFVRDELELDAAGQPQLDRHWRSVRNPHLVCVGFRYPANEGWLQAIGRVAHEAVAHIADARATSPTASCAAET